MSQGTYYQHVGRQFVEQSGVDAAEYDDRFEEIGRAIFGGGGHNAAGVRAYQAVDEHIAEEEILPRLTKEVIEEHDRNPIGQHSDDLQRVLNYFRRQPVEGKYIVVEVERNERWCVGVVTEARGAIELTDESYDTPKDAERAVFRKRVAEFREEHGEGEDDA